MAVKKSVKKSAVVVLKPLAKTVAQVKEKKAVPLDQFSFEQLISWRDRASVRATKREVQIQAIRADTQKLLRILKHGDKRQHSDLLWISKLNKILKKKAGIK